MGWGSWKIKADRELAIAVSRRRRVGRKVEICLLQIYLEKAKGFSDGMMNAYNCSPHVRQWDKIHHLHGAKNISKSNRMSMEAEAFKDVE